MTAALPPVILPRTPPSRHRWMAWSAVGLVVVAFAVWAAIRIHGLSESTQATNPILRWEYVFKRQQTPQELWDLTTEHLRLTVTAVVAGFVIASLLAALALRLRWTFTPITVFTGFLYTIPSIALFGVLAGVTSNFVAAEVALTSYTLLILVRNIVAGIDGVPRSALDAADGLGMGRVRRLFTVEVPLAAPVIITGIRVATVTTIGLVGITTFIQLGGLGSLIFDGYNRDFTTLLVLGSVLSIALAVILDLALAGLERLLTPWTRRAQA